MTRTFVAEQVLEIARRVLREQESGRPVDPERIAWAEQTLRGNAPPVAPARAFAPQETDHA